MTIRVCVVDDHRLFRAGVVELIQSGPDLIVVAEGASGMEAITLAHEMKPEVMLLDVEMPGPGPTATVHKVREVSPTTRVVILTMHDDADLVRELLDAGASGYLHKSAGSAELIAAITAAAGTGDSVVIAVSRRSASDLGRRSHPHDSAVLSSRELEVLVLLAAAKSNRDIARALYISDGTVKRHLANIYARLRVTSRMGAVRRGIESGLIANPYPAGGIRQLGRSQDRRGD